MAEPIRVQRYNCSSCPRTFSDLPNGLLPVMRWNLQHVFMLAGELLVQPASLHSLSRKYNVSRGALRRLRLRLPLLIMLIHQLSLEAGYIDELQHAPLDPARLKLTSLWPSWNKFSWQLHRALYPLHRHASCDQHNLYHPSG
jgi:hypothetical protein